MPLKDLTGKKYGHVTIVRYNGCKNGKHSMWIGRCVCGNEKSYFTEALRNASDNFSCGCVPKNHVEKHGMHKTTEYRSWLHMKGRCTNPNYHNFKYWGGRGIKVCDRWIDSFENFYEDMGPKPRKSYTIDRIDNDGDYCKENCRWASRKTQLRNSRHNKMITWNGETRCVNEWAEILNIHPKTLSVRIQRWDLERAMTEPVNAEESAGWAAHEKNLKTASEKP